VRNPYPALPYKQEFVNLDMMNIDMGERLIALRKALGLTQKTFGEKIHISKGYITSLEKSRRPLNDRLVRLICDVYSVNEEWLRTGSGSMFCNSPNAQLSEIISIFNRLTPDFQNFIYNQLKSLLEMNHNHHKQGT
jgi:transcriptional regulator with XRE-family HTH domain